MNLLHISPYYAPAYAFGGVVRAVEGMAQALAQRGHTVTILTTDALSQTSRCENTVETVDHGVRVVRVRNVSVWLRGHANLSTPLTMRQTARQWVSWADVVHCHEFRTTENLLVTPIAASLNKPLVLSPHGTLTTSTGRSSLKQWWDRLFSPAVARRFRAVVALTNSELSDVQALWAQFGARAKFAVIPNGISLDEFASMPDGAAFRSRWGIGEQELVCLFLGRLHPRKGVDVLVRAFQEANVPSTRLILAGPDEGMLARLQPLLDKRIVLTGYVDSQQRLEALASADVFALPGTGEGLSMAVLEAMAAGLPLILSPGNNLPEAAETGAGLIVEPAVAPLADALRDVLTNPARRQVMAAQARELVRERFTWAQAAAELEEIYRNIST